MMKLLRRRWHRWGRTSGDRQARRPSRAHHTESCRELKKDLAKEHKVAAVTGGDRQPHCVLSSARPGPDPGEPAKL